jgi:hypothetical protein
VVAFFRKQIQTKLKEQNSNIDKAIVRIEEVVNFEEKGNTDRGSSTDRQLVFKGEAMNSNSTLTVKALEASAVSGSKLDVSVVSNSSITSIHSHVSNFDGRVEKEDLDIYTMNSIKSCT